MSKPRLKAGVWWAVTRGPGKLPVIFGKHRSVAEENCCTDEYVVRVYIREATTRDRARRTDAPNDHRRRTR